MTDENQQPGLSQEQIDSVIVLYSNRQYQEAIDEILVLDESYPNVPFLFFSPIGFMGINHIISTPKSLILGN